MLFWLVCDKIKYDVNVTLKIGFFPFSWEAQFVHMKSFEFQQFSNMGNFSFEGIFWK